MNPNGPEDIENFKWEKLNGGGTANIGEALIELNKKLSKDGFLNSMVGNYLPTIFFITDGYSLGDFKNELAEIKNNKWFLKARKICFAVGDSPNMSVLSEIVGNSEAIVTIENMDLLSRLFYPVEALCGSLLPDSSLSKVKIDEIIDDDDWDDDYFDTPKPVMGENVILPDDSYQTGSNIKLVLPIGDIMLNEKTVKINKCQVRPCSPDEALECCFEINGNNDSTQLTNKSDKKVFIIRQISQDIAMEIDLTVIRAVDLIGDIKLDFSPMKAKIIAMDNDSFIRFIILPNETMDLKIHDTICFDDVMIQCKAVELDDIWDDEW